MEKRVKIKDIAEKCGFSSTLVSLVLNDKATRYGIKPETQEKVLFVADQMGFFKDHSGRQPADESITGSNICMISTGLEDAFIYQVSPFLDKAFSSMGFNF